MSDFPSSLDVTESLYDRMVECAPEEWREQLADPLTWDDAMRDRVAALLIPAARDEAIAQAEARGDRGFILYDQKAIETYIYYVGSEFADTVLWMADAPTKAELNEVLADYDPQSEAAIAIASAESVQVMWIKQDGQVATQGAQEVNPLPIALPEGVTAETSERDGCYGYDFTDAKLGKLGRITFMPLGNNQLDFHCEFATSGDAARDDEAKAYFEPIAQRAIAAWTAALQRKAGN
ncbi:MAG: hypothetical protein ACFB9N_07905 [Geitlerinemataceae cyanobacterium]